MQDILDELAALSQEVTAELRSQTMDSLKKELEPLVYELGNLNQTKDFISGQLLDTNKKIQDIEKKIRSLWSPHILGTQKAEINFGDIKLKTEQVLNVSVSEEDNSRDSVLDWLANNGYKDCMRYDINTNKMKAIASDLFKTQDVKIPGLKYTPFNKISIK